MLTDEQKAALRARYPHHWFCRVMRNGVERIVAIPKSDPPRDIPSMPGLDLGMLHGSTIRLQGEDAWTTDIGEPPK